MVIGLGEGTVTECEGSAPADAKKFVARATSAIPAHCAAIHFILRTILDITRNSQPVVNG